MPPSATAPDIPPGWSYNPSDWRERFPILGLALLGFGIASYLAFYQWGVFGSVWEPFFGDGSRVVLHAGVSKLLPVPDAALGAAGYLLDAVSGAIGGRDRWRRMPWIVVIFGLAVGPLGATSIMLVILQPVRYGHWCSLCLASALISVTMIGPAMDEFLASLQFLKRTADSGQSVWRAFWGLSAGRTAGAGPWPRRWDR